MKRAELTTLGLEPTMIEEVMSLYGKAVGKNLESINALTAERDELKAKADKLDATTQQFNQLQETANGYKSQLETIEFKEKLTGLKIKPDRVEPFIKLLGDDRSDEAVNKLKETYSEWVISADPEPPTDPDPKKPTIATGGNPTPPPSGTPNEAELFASVWKT